MFILDKSRVVMIDVDDTICIWTPTPEHLQQDHSFQMGTGKFQFPVTPHKFHLEFIRKLKVQGYGIVVWSAGGEEWALQAVQKLGIEDLVDIVMSKPVLLLDDMPTTHLPRRTYFDPITGEKTSLKDDKKE